MHCFHRQMLFAVLVLVLGGSLVAACGPQRPAAAPAASPTVAPTPTAPPVPSPAPVVIDFWSTERQPARLAVYEELAARFTANRPGVRVRITPVDEATAGLELVAAAPAGNLPDLARLGMERLPRLAAAGLLDEDAAAAVIDTVGRADFRPGPLRMVSSPETGRAWAVPLDGWLQAIWYRRDVFESAGLATPVTWEQIDAACDALAESRAVPFALGLPSDPTGNYTHQVFEQIAISNNAWPFDAERKPSFSTPEMVEALRFYVGLARCAPPPVVSVAQAADHYLRGESAMLFYSTYVMDDLVDGVERADGSIVLPAAPDLAQRTGFASGIAGPGGTAAYGQVVALAILRDADPLAQEFARFLLTDAYLEVLALAPFGKIPVLESATDDWLALSPVFANYSPATLGHIINGYDTMRRWVLHPQYDNDTRAAIGEIENRLLIPQAIIRILSGEMTPEIAAGWLQAQAEALGPR